MKKRDFKEENKESNISKELQNECLILHLPHIMVSIYNITIILIIYLIKL